MNTQKKKIITTQKNYKKVFNKENKKIFMVSSDLNKQGKRAFFTRKRGKKYILIKNIIKQLSTSYQQVINKISTIKSLVIY